MMTDPRRYLVRMLIFLAVVVAIAALLHAPQGKPGHLLAPLCVFFRQLQIL